MRSAAVMGSLLSHQSVYSNEWTPSDSVDSDTALTSEIQKCAAVAPMLRQRVEEHLAWIAEYQEAKVSEQLASEYPNLTLLGDLQTRAIREQRLDEEHGRIRDNIEAKIVAIEAEIEALTSSKSHGMSQSRRNVIDTHDEQMKVIIAKARELAFGDRARVSVEQAISKLKDPNENPSQDPRQVYSSDEFKGLQAEEKRIAADKERVELQLQAFFDHHSQGASKAESAKVERVALKLPPNLEREKAGNKLITLMEEYMVGRGNELWAIIPDITRMSHDIDPILHMHWQPSVKG